METKKDIQWRLYLVYLFISLFAVSIIVKIFHIQFAEGQHWREKAHRLTTSKRTFYAVRGNIFDVNGSLLATSLPYFEVGMDVNTEYITKEVFDKYVDSVSISLSNLFKDRPAYEYKKRMIDGRKSHDRYILLQRNVSYQELQQLKQFPLFRLGRYKGGLVYVQTNRRERPFKLLAQRTIGYKRHGIQPVGLEGAYDHYLQGDSSTRIMQKIAGGVWMPIGDETETQPKDGCDVITTIDINIQDVAEDALYRQLAKHNAGFGCVVLMEVETGQIKAIANLTKKDSGVYVESYNHAIGRISEPGSTFKLASVCNAIEDGYVDLDDTIDIGNGTVKFYDLTIRDSHEPEESTITIKKAFEKSSNVAIAKLVSKYYAKQPQKFIDRLYNVNLNSPLGISIPGEGKPRIKSTSDKDWYGTTLPFMSIGYEVLLTPMQILAFYNAFANDGVLVKPRFVKEIRRHGELVHQYEPEIINPAIYSKETIQKARIMMEGVVENGTAKNLRVTTYPIAGKTGTAQVAKKGTYGKKERNVTYQASFVGYFPADKPKYSCIVLVNAPSNNVYYGNVVAGPIFREIADKVYATNLKIHKAINIVDNNKGGHSPVIGRAYSNDARTIIDSISANISLSTSSEWVSHSKGDSTTIIQKKDDLTKILRAGEMPNLYGLTIQDALYLLENKGIQVKFNGYGIIKKQSIKAGEPLIAGAVVTVELS